MIRTGLLTGAAMLIFATPAFADCKDNFGELQKVTSSTAMSTELRRDMNKLRSAARTLMEYEKSGTCEDVVDAIQEIVEKRKEKRQDRLERKADLARYTNAEQVSAMKGIVRVDDVQGMDIYNMKGKEIGVVEAVTLDADKGEIAYVVMSHGGFLGVGDKLFAVPWKSFRMTKDKDELVLDVSEKTLEKAPGFDDDNWPNMGDPKWRSRIDTYYGSNKQG